MGTLTLLALPACSPSQPPVAHSGDPTTVPPTVVLTTTTSTTAPRASRRRPSAPKAPATGAAVGIYDEPASEPAFWRALANCECASGHCGGQFHGYFQFSDDTAAKVGYHDDASYDEQVAMAKFWLTMIGGRGGSRAGWPVCWWRALKAVS